MRLISDTFPLRSGTRPGSPLAISPAGLEVRGREIRQEKETTGIKSEGEEENHHLFADDMISYAESPEDCTKTWLSKQIQ